MPSALRFWHIMFSFYIAGPQVLSDYPRWLKLLRNCLQLLMRWPTIDREKTRDTIIVRVSKRMNQNMLNNNVIVHDVKYCFCICFIYCFAFDMYIHIYIYPTDFRNDSTNQKTLPSNILSSYLPITSLGIYLCICVCIYIVYFPLCVRCATRETTAQQTPDLTSLQPMITRIPYINLIREQSV